MDRTGPTTETVDTVLVGSPLSSPVRRVLMLVLGRGAAGRLEVSLARHLVTEPLWAQVAPGNARSVRAFQAAGYRQGALSAMPRSAGCSGSRS